MGNTTLIILACHADVFWSIASQTARATASCVRRYSRHLSSTSPRNVRPACTTAASLAASVCAACMRSAYVAAALRSAARSGFAPGGQSRSLPSVSTT